MPRYKIYLSVWAFLFVTLSTLSGAGQDALNPAYTAYIEKWKATALAQQAQYGIPASITLAQGLLESGAGQSDLATTANNHFGIKCHSDWQGKTFRKDDDARDECFRSYAKADDSFRDHSLFLKRKRYEVLFTYDINDYKSWANGLKACGYATDPNYPGKLIRIIETYGLDKIKEGKSRGGNDNRDMTSTTVRPTPDEPSASSGKPPKPDKDGKNGKENKGKSEQIAGSDTVVWTPSVMRSNRLYADRAYGRTNGRRFIVAQDGDTWGSIAYTLGMEEKTLRRINEATDKQQLRGGDRIYMFPKRRKADRKHTRHLVQYGETAWDIAQRYGIRVSSLYKINGIPEGTPLKTEQWIDLR